MRTCSPAVWAAADSGSRSKSSCARARACAKTAVGVEGSFGKEAYQLSIGLLREAASAGVAHSSSAMSYARHHNPYFRSKNLNFRELDRPVEAAAKTTRESPSTKSRRASTPSRVTPEEADQALQFQEVDMFAPSKKWAQFSSKASGAAAARPSCMLLGWFFAFPIQANMLSFLLGQILQGEPVLPCKAGGDTIHSMPKAPQLAAAP